MGSILECVQQTAEGGRLVSLMWTDKNPRIWLAESIANFSGDLSAMTAPSFILSPTSLTEYPVSTIGTGGMAGCFTLRMKSSLLDYISYFCLVELLGRESGSLCGLQPRTG